MGKLDIKTGQRFGRLSIVKEVEPYVTPKGQSFRKFECKCDCGNIKNVVLSDLRKGNTSSCGCIHKEIFSNVITKHGLRYHPLYETWKGMKQRCSNPNHQDYIDYGGRGITVCNRWRNSFSNFLEDMGEKPSPEYSIERRNNNEGYDPENCYWATKSEQMKNRRPYKINKV